MRCFATSILLGGSLLAAAPAFAQTYDSRYPVCIEIHTIDGRSIDCSYASMAQCTATASGLGATCYPNPYAAPGGPASPRAMRHRKRPY
jgi:hypothetical protein